MSVDTGQSTPAGPLCNLGVETNEWTIKQRQTEKRYLSIIVKSQNFEMQTNNKMLACKSHNALVLRAGASDITYQKHTTQRSRKSVKDSCHVINYC